MDVFDRIVVGVDGTDWGLEALHQALTLAPAQATVDAVTALNTGIAVHAGYDAVNVAAELELAAETARKQAADVLGGRAGSTARIVQGDATRVLRKACADADATLLALGGRHSSRFLGMMLGDTGTSLLHDAALPVLVSRPRWGERWHPRRVTVGVDGSEVCHAALAVADDLAERLGSELEVVAATGGKVIDRDGTWAARVTSWEAGHPVATLVHRSQLADLLVVGSRGLHGVRALGSVSERVAHRARCSVLVVHPHA